MTLDSTAELDALAAAIAARPARPSRWSLHGRVMAAVCVPMLPGPEDVEVWTIKRTAGLRYHAREIAFPGGKADPGDRDLLDTALREMEEELGVPRARLRVLGSMPAVPTATSHFALNPFVIAVDPDAAVRPDPGEVALLIRTPIRHFFDGRVPYRAVVLDDHRRSPIFDFAVGAMYGASAHILEEVLLAYGEVRHVTLPEPELTGEIPWL